MKNIKKGGSVFQQSRLLKQMKGVRLRTRQRLYHGTAKQTCKTASLKIAIIAEAHHGLQISDRCLTDSHDTLLPAAFAAATFLVLNFSTLCG